MRNKHKLSTNWYTRQACCEVHLFLTQELRKNGKSGLDGIRHFAKESVDESDYHYLIRLDATRALCDVMRLPLTASGEGFHGQNEIWFFQFRPNPSHPCGRALFSNESGVT